MSIRIMFRKCEHCRHRYTYNPSIGNFGVVCPKCHKAQSEIISVSVNKLKKN
jgi:Zn finger protein HypA/HybF involved in hydrogenase expression